jgi:hypothetical protein
MSSPPAALFQVRSTMGAALSFTPAADVSAAVCSFIEAALCLIFVLLNRHRLKRSAVYTTLSGCLIMAGILLFVQAGHDFGVRATLAFYCIDIVSSSTAFVSLPQPPALCLAD